MPKGSIWIAEHSLPRRNRRDVGMTSRRNGVPRPRRFDRNLVVIGAGSAGLVAAYLGAALRAGVTLVEGNRMGGDCLNTGCVPSKALIRCARLAAESRRATSLGLGGPPLALDFSAVMERVQATIGAVAPHDSVERYASLGVDVRRGRARIVSPWCVEVDGRPITTRTIIIAAGADPIVPDLPGLAETEYFTSENLWRLRTLPPRLLVLGGGPIGCEMAQAFAQLGSQVTLVEQAPKLLMREDDEVSAFVAERMAADGVRVLTSHKGIAIETADAGRVIRIEHDGVVSAEPFDAVLVAIGRRARTAGYGLEELGIGLTPTQAVETNAYLQTIHPNILACGDVVGPYQFTHAAAHQAKSAVLTGLFAPFYRSRPDYSVMPAVTFTDPEVARVGLNEREARAQCIAYEYVRTDLRELDRAIVDGTTEGFLKVLTPPGKDRILGATIVGAHAGELLAEFVLAMRHGIGLKGVLNTVHAYPTYAEANRYVAGAWRRANVSPTALGLLARFHAWRRGGAAHHFKSNVRQPGAPSA
jgi:pyruvate/2-oxoglutarate dehydrogenase complex dihydrolipoamide dehydrogenase (E3) component